MRFALSFAPLLRRSFRAAVARWFGWPDVARSDRTRHDPYSRSGFAHYQPSQVTPQVHPTGNPVIEQDTAPANSSICANGRRHARVRSRARRPARTRQSDRQSLNRKRSPANTSIKFLDGPLTRRMTSQVEQHARNVPTCKSVPDNWCYTHSGLSSPGNACFV